MEAMATDHRVTILDPDDPRTPSIIAERASLGLDRFDEVWEGIYHVNPIPLSEHGRIQSHLHGLLYPVVQAAGLRMQLETAVYPIELPDDTNYRGPDLLIAHPDVYSRRGVEGRASLVVEIHSPGDEAFEKIPFYGRVGVAELLIIHRDTKEVRRWIGDGHELTEVASTDDGRHHIACLPVALSTSDGHLHIDIADDRTTI